jgi:hypothetical protein
MKPASLARWQERMEMTQAEAAAALGLPLGTYRGIVQGRRYARKGFAHLLIIGAGPIG